MRTKIVVITGVVVLLALTFRLFYQYRDKRADERSTYVHNLNFKFSARVDSLVPLNNFNNGIVFFHIEKGELDATIEKKMNRELEFNSDLCFVFLMRGGTKGIRLSGLNTYAKGDSLSVDSDKDQVEIYRESRLITSSKISEIISGSPF